MFEVARMTGAVRTVRTRYEPTTSYKVYVQAVDTSALTSDVAVLDIVAGDRPPQFMLANYDVAVEENAPIGARFGFLSN